MTTVLLDTNVLSELVRPRPEARVVAFVDALRAPLISAVTIHEIAFGAASLRDPVRRAKLETWATSLRQRFESRLVAIDWDIAAHAGRLRASAASKGVVVSQFDSLIAACAIQRGVPIATRNVRDFEAFGVEFINPWERR